MAYGTWSTTRVALGTVVNTAAGTTTPFVGVTNVGAMTRSGTITPGFGKTKRLSKGSATNLPINPFGFVKNEWNPHFGDITQTIPPNLNDKIIMTGSAVTSFGLTTIDNCVEPSAQELLVTDNKAIQKLLEHIKGQKVNLVQVYAERKMTADLIGSTAVRLANSFMQLRKGNIKSAARMLKTSVSQRKVEKFNSEYRKRKGGNALASAWLELQYGWRPWLGDLYGAAEWLASKQLREIKVSASGRSVEGWERASRKQSFPGTILDDQYLSYEIRYGAWYQTDGVALATVKEAGFLNPATIAWELTPWSFVVDWFIPIGNYINTLDATIGLIYEKGYRTQFVDAARWQTVFGDGVTLQSNGRYYAGTAKSSRKKVSVSRTVLTAFPQMQFPTFKNPFSFEHAANAVALLTQAFVQRKA